MANGGWDFTADTEIQEQLANRMDELADNFDQKVGTLYEQIDSIGTNKYWVGEDYDQFCVGTEGYKGAIKDLSNSIRLYANHTRKISEGTSELSTELIGIVNTITSRNVDYQGIDPIYGNEDHSYNGSGAEYNAALNDYSVITDDSSITSEKTSSILNETPSNETPSVIPDSNDKAPANSTPETEMLDSAYKATTQDNPETIDTSYKAITPENPENPEGDSLATQEKYHNSGYIESFTSNEYWQTFGDDMAKNYANVNWENGIVGAAFSAVGGTVASAGDLVIAAGNGVFDGANDAIEGIQWLINGVSDGFDGYEQDQPVDNSPSAFTNPYANGYYSQIGDDFANDWSQFADGYNPFELELTQGIVNTAVDVVQLAANAVLDTAQGAVECVEWLWNCIGGLF